MRRRERGHASIAIAGLLAQSRMVSYHSYEAFVAPAAPLCGQGAGEGLYPGDLRIS